MSFEAPEAGDFSATRPLAEINMIPLIDVMLVLLIVFMVTAPLLTHAVRVDLPQARSQPEIQHRDDLDLALKADGSLYWNNVNTTLDTLPGLMTRAAANADSHIPAPELHIRADHTVPYGRVAEVMALASRSGLQRIGFVSEPPHLP